MFVIFDLFDNDCDIFIDVVFFVKVFFVVVLCELFGGLFIWFLIIGLDGVEIVGWFYFEIGIFGIVVIIKFKLEFVNVGE